MNVRDSLEIKASEEAIEFTTELWGSLVTPVPEASGAFFALVREQAQRFVQNKGTDLREWPQKEKLLGPLIALDKWELGLTAPLLNWIDEYLTRTEHPLAHSDGGKSDLTMWLGGQVKEASTGSRIDWISGTLSSKLAGILRYNPTSGALEITSMGKSQGHTTASIYPCLRLEICEELGISDRSLPPNLFKELVMKVAKEQHSMETPLTELKRKLNRFQKDLPTPQELQGAEKPDLITQATEGPWHQILKKVEPLFEAYDLKDDTDKEHFFRFLVGLAARTHNPGCPLQWALTLSGNGGCGKTSFGELMALKAAPAVSVAMGQLGTKGLIENISSSSLLILDELDNYTRKRDLAELKDFITASSHQVRKAYRADSEGVQAQWVFLATTNAATLPNDDGAQMRRWAWVNLDGGVAEGEKRAEFLKIKAPMLHALGFLSYLGGYGYSKYVPTDTLPKELEAIETPDEATAVSYFSEAIERVITLEDGKLAALGTKDLWYLVSNDAYHPRKAPQFIASLESKGWSKVTGLGRKKCWIPPTYGNQEPGWVLLLPDQLRNLKDQLSRQSPS